MRCMARTGITELFFVGVLPGRFWRGFPNSNSYSILPYKRWRCLTNGNTFRRNDGAEVGVAG